MQLHHVLHAFQLDNVAVAARPAWLRSRLEAAASYARTYSRRRRRSSTNVAQLSRFAVVATGTPMRKQPAPANVTPPFRRIGEDGHARSAAPPVCVSASLERECLAQRKQPEHLRVAHAKAQPALQDAQLSFDSCALE